MCTCDSIVSTCGKYEFKCLDPNATSEVYGCKEAPVAAAPCSADSQRKWFVEETAQATALAGAINCTGGVFEVEWTGNIVVKETMVVLDDTTLNVTGIGPVAGMDGNSTTRLFTVVKGFLHVSGLNVSNGRSAVGGAVSATESKLTFNNTFFIGNGASYSGGAVYAVDSSTVSWTGDTQFINNTSGFDGGALYASANSSISWGGKTIFLNNGATDDGGAVYADYGSSVSWNAETTFSHNTAFSGGALYVSDGSRCSWSEATTFFINNTADTGGALAVQAQSSVFWSGQAWFYSNTAGSGALYTFSFTRLCRGPTKPRSSTTRVP